MAKRQEAIEDPYKILGISKSASDDEIRQAYRRAAQKYHPDAGGDAWVFQQVQLAYEQLLNPSPSHAPSEQPTTPAQTPAPKDDAPTGAEAIESAGGLESVRLWFHGLFSKATSSQLPLQSETCYFILANVLDIVLTNMLLRRQAIEANPFAAYFFLRWGFNGMIAFKMVITAFICVVAQYIAVRNLAKARFLLITGILIVGAVVVYSMVLYWRMRGA